MQTLANRIIINDRCLRGPLTGVGHYVAQLLAELPEVAPDLEFLPFYRTYLSRPPKPAGDAPAPRPKTGRRPPWWLRRTALGLYNTGFRTAARLKHCALYHEPNHIPAPWSGPVVTTVHDLSVLRHPEWHPADRVRWYEKDFLPSLGRSRHFITVSEFSRQEMIELLGLSPDQITAIPLGVRAIFHPRPPQETQPVLARIGLDGDFLLYTGTIEPRKNVPGLLEAYAGLDPATRRRFPLVLAGVSGWGREKVEDLMANLHLGEDVRLLGYVDDTTLACLYAGARALVWPSFYEGFGLPPLEAMASGTAVITSQAGSLSEVTGDAAMLVDPEDTSQLREAIEEILSDDARVETLQNRGLARSREFSWSHCAAGHAAIYRETLQQASFPAPT